MRLTSRHSLSLLACFCSWMLLSGTSATAQETDPLQQARALTLTGSPEEAMELARQLLAQDDTRADAWAVLGWSALRAGALEDATAAAAKVQELAAGKDADQLVMLAQQLTNNMASKSQQLAAEAEVQREEEAAKQRLEQAKAHNLAGRYTEAAEAYTAAWRNKREDWSTWVAAMNAWQMANRLAPRAALVREYARTVPAPKLADIPELAKVEKRVQRAARIELPKRLSAAKAALKKDDLTAAAEILRQANQIDPDDRGVKKLIKQLRERGGQMPEANDHLPGSSQPRATDANTAREGNPNAPANQKSSVGLGGKYGMARRMTKTAAIGTGRGLGWLTSQQASDGRWQGANKEGDVWATSLALLAMMADGNAPNHGALGESVVDGATWLATQQDDRGLIGNTDALLDHAVATWALAEACGLSRNESLRLPARRALEALRTRQLPAGGWPMTPTEAIPNLVVTGWAALATATGANFELCSPTPNSRQQTLTWLHGCVDPATGLVRQTNLGSAPVTPNDPIGATALVQLVHFFCKQDPRAVPSMQPGIEAILATKAPSSAASWMFCGHTSYQWGSKYWKAWLQREPQIVSSQLSDGQNAGSWAPTSPTSPRSGRVATTALMVLSLSSGFRFSKLIR